MDEMTRQSLERAKQLARSPHLDEAGRAEAAALAQRLEFGATPRALELVAEGISFDVAAATVAMDEAAKPRPLIPGNSYADPQDPRTWGAA